MTGGTLFGWSFIRKTELIWSKIGDIKREALYT